MIDLKNVEKYRENNRIEAKKALGGLPHSIWETYSAFANTLGGVILLGVEEYKDKSFHVVDLPNPEGMIDELWQGLSDTKKVNINILSKSDITIEKYEGKRFIAIKVPRANRFDKPIYIEENIKSGTYRRGGEGDYRCSAEEIEAMKRESARITDNKTKFGISELDENTVSLCVDRLGKECFRNILYSSGAVFSSESGECITSDCLLMFGRREAVKKYFPDFQAICRTYDEDGNIKKEIFPINLYGFYLSVRNLLDRQICLLGKNRRDENAILGALNEALINSIIHGDYEIDTPLCVEIFENEIIFTNPGSLRIPPTSVLLGGISDRRNEGIARLFYLCGGDTEAGGIKSIYEIWRKNKWCPPSIEELFSPDRVVLRLSMVKGSRVYEIAGSPIPIHSRRSAVIGYITEHIEVTGGDIASLLGISRESAVRLLRSLADEEILVFEKRGKEYFYKLKS